MGKFLDFTIENQSRLKIKSMALFLSMVVRVFLLSRKLIFKKLKGEFNELAYTKGMLRKKSWTERQFHTDAIT